MSKPTHERSLWTDRPAGSEHGWLTDASQRPANVRELRPAAPPEPPKRNWRKLLAVLGAIFALVGAGVVGALVAGDGSPTSDEREVASLPAAGGTLSENKINAIYARASRGVVSVQVRESGSSAASGTGFVIDDAGTIVTNSHVIDTASTAQVRFDDGEEPVDARVLGTDPSSDLAVLKVDPSDTGKLYPLALADSERVKVGDTAIAIGFPLGLDKTATSGIVSGLGREIEAPNGFRIDEVIQTDAPINPGNSGGPLLDGRGRVIGVNSQIATAGGGSGSVGIGFAVPSNTVREIVPQLKTGGKIARPFLGVSTTEDGGNRGALIASVVGGGPADRAGLRAGTDVITSIEGRKITDPEDVSEAIADRKPGETVEITVARDGGSTTLDVELGTRPEQVPDP